MAGLSHPAFAEFEDVVAPAPQHTKDFWRDVIDPHGVEVDDLVYKAQQALAVASNSKASDLDLPSQETREKVYRDLFGMMTYARKLSPSNTKVLIILGHCAEELGRTKQAIEAFTTVTNILGPEKAPIEATSQLGMIYLRLGQLDDAIRWLRVAQAAPGGNAQDRYSRRYNYEWNAQHTSIYLATALALQNRTAEATDLLQSKSKVDLYSSYNTSLASFALAVLFDRDDQRSAAFEVLDRMQTTLSTSYPGQVQNEIAMFEFVPPEDRHYYNGLFYESIGAYPEARAEWVTYASVGDAKHRARALEHVELIDKQSRAPVARQPGLLVPPPRMPRPYIKGPTP